MNDRIFIRDIFFFKLIYFNLFVEQYDEGYGIWILVYNLLVRKF